MMRVKATLQYVELVTRVRVVEIEGEDTNVVMAKLNRAVDGWAKSGVGVVLDDVDLGRPDAWDEGSLTDEAWEEFQRDTALLICPPGNWMSWDYDLTPEQQQAEDAARDARLTDPEKS